MPIGEIFKESEKLYETEEAYEENLELYEQLTGSLIMQNPDRAETISQNAAYLQRFVIFYSFMSLSLPRVRKRANVCRRIINIKETQKHEKPLIFQGFFYVFHIVKQRWRRWRDSNSRTRFRVTRFPIVRPRPD